MPTAYEKYSHMPQSNIHEIFSVAHSAKSLVKVTCCIPYGGKLKDVIFYGHIKDVAGREAYLDIAEQEVLTRSCRIYPNEFEYFFCLDKTYPQRMRLGYLGTGKILSIKKNNNNDIVTMHLRFAAKNVERRMRRDRRIDWRPEYSKVAGVIRLDAIPESRQDLKKLIQDHYHYAIKNTQFINISAAGACALLPDEAELKSLSAEANLLVYIISGKFDMINATYVLLGKKIGITNSDVNGMVKLRMQFTHELDLRYNMVDLDWIEITNTGSTRLGNFIDEYCTGDSREHDLAAGFDQP